MKHLPRLALIAALLASLLPLTTARAQEDPVAALMARMSTAAKVGQLFMVTFPGAEVAQNSLIAELIRDYHIGGVLLLPENGNIVNEGDTPRQVATLVEQLQATAWAATQGLTTTTVESTGAPEPFVPLFVAVNHEGNGTPYTGVINGLTPLPSAMAIGATWNPAHAEAVGQIVGRELDALGINMLLGPVLDVPETVNPAGDLGVRAFGGDPFWVGQMGLAYIRGVHLGGAGRVAVIAKRFPGLGMSDRSLDEEVSTVQRTLEKLRQVDLAPFFAVAQANELAARPDGLLVSHIRFRGLEGGRFVSTRPVSVDSQVLPRLLSQPELTEWRASGGLTVSDGLGLRALRRFYDPSEQTFNGRRIAQEAFLAGNDVLLLSQFALTGRWDDRAANVRSTITFFQEKYDSDAAFKALVDAAVARILRLKLSLYGGRFTLEATQRTAETLLESVGLDREVSAAVSRDSITLLSPPSLDLLPDPPTIEDTIVIFTDARTAAACAACPRLPIIAPRALAETIARLYGPQATGQIDPRRISSFTFSQLEDYLNAPPAAPAPTPAAGETVTPTLAQSVQSALQRADWVIFAMLNPGADPPQSGAVRRFLAEQADLLRGPHLVVMAYDAPYYLDATEISKLSAYFALYSHIDPFIEASARALFGEFMLPVGSSPVSVPGINYDLGTQILPDPDQTIALEYTISHPAAEGTLTPEPTAQGQPSPEAPIVAVGDQLLLRTGVIMDHNGHPVPNGTPVQFIFTYPEQGLEHSLLATTRDGVAEATLTLERTGRLDIYVQADPVPRRVALQITIQEGGAAVIVPITPTPRPTARPTPTATTWPEPAASVPAPVTTPLSDITPTPTPVPSAGPQDAGPLDLLLALVACALVGVGGFYSVRLRRLPLVQALRVALWCVVGGMALYLGYVLRLPGAAWLREQSGALAGGWTALFGSLLTLAVIWLARLRRSVAGSAA
jgi:beta-N-acetylhexosaminidase